MSIHKINLNDIYEKASKYRAQQDGLAFDSQNEDLNSLIYLSRMFSFGEEERINYSFIKIKNKKVLFSREYNFSIKNLKTFLYAYFSILERYEDESRDTNQEFYNLLENQKKDYKIFKDKIDQLTVELNSHFNKAIKTSVFIERGFEERYDLIDFKKNETLSGYYQAEFKKGCIESKYRHIQEITPLYCAVGASSSNNDGEGGLRHSSSDTTALWRKNRRFKYIVAKREVEPFSIDIKTHEAKLELIFFFDRKSDFNQIDIDTGSSLPIIFEDNFIQYWDGSIYEDVDIIFKNDELIKHQFYFRKITSNKIKITFKQKRNIGGVAISNLDWLEKLHNDSKIIGTFPSEKETLYKIFDLSIDNVSFFNKSYRQKGFFRALEGSLAKKPLSAMLSWNGAKDIDDCYIEASVELEIFGEEGFNNLNLPPQRINVPVYENINIKELLLFKDRKATLTFVPEKINGISLYKNGDTVPGGSFLSNLDIPIDAQYKVLWEGEEVAENTEGDIDGFYSCEIELNEIQARNMKIDDVFEIHYTAKKRINSKDENVYLEDGIIIFKSKYQESYVNIRPRFLLRNKSKKNESCLIQNYMISIEEKETEANLDIPYKRVTSLE